MAYPPGRCDPYCRYFNFSEKFSQNPSNSCRQWLQKLRYGPKFIHPSILLMHKEISLDKKIVFEHVITNFEEFPFL